MMMEKGKKRQMRSSERRFENLHGPASRHVSPRNVRGQHRLPLLEQDGQNTPDRRPSHVGFKQSGQRGGDERRGIKDEGTRRSLVSDTSFIKVMRQRREASGVNLLRPASVNGWQARASYFETEQ